MFPLPSLHKVFRPIPLIAAGAAVAAALTCTVGSQRPHRQLPRPAAGLTFPADPTADAIARRVAAKEIVASDALAGRLTLVEAAALIGWLNDRGDRPLRLEAFHVAQFGPPPYGGWTRDELVCLHAIVCIESRAEVECPARAEEVRASLEAEFGAERACGRPVALPPVAEPEGLRLLAFAARAWERCRAGGLPGYTRPGLRAYLEQVVGAETERQ